ncbi:MAG TPA: BBP7 family outer membrane beta-barrel protein, partial [Gemmataceae bacterium]|nr:BBP7 family outer membrane beta-barrel protein [Gemmataceae bacterium]
VRPLGKWWLNPSLELGWASKDTPLPTMQLRVPGLRHGPVVPLEGVTADSFRVGVEMAGGWWCGEGQQNGIDAGFYLLGTSDRTVTGVAPGVLVLFPDGASRSPQLVAFPEPVASTFYGTFPATYSTWYVGAEMNYRRGLVRESHLRLDAVAGYRFGYVADEVFLGEVPTEGHDDYRRNRFAVSNQFHGGQVGIVGECRADAWSVTGSAKVALGAVSSSISESGLFTAPDVSSGGGFTSLASRCVGSRFAVLPSLSATVGRKMGEHGRLFVGYSFQYLNTVVRLGDVLNPATNAEQLRVTDFWVQAVKLGWEWRY